MIKLKSPLLISFEQLRRHKKGVKRVIEILGDFNSNNGQDSTTYIPSLCLSDNLQIIKRVKEKIPQNFEVLTWNSIWIKTILNMNKTKRVSQFSENYLSLFFIRLILKTIDNCTLNNLCFIFEYLTFRIVLI